LRLRRTGRAPGGQGPPAGGRRGRGVGGGGLEPPRGAARSMVAVAATAQAGPEARRHYRRCKVVTTAARGLATAREKRKARGRAGNNDAGNGREMSGSGSVSVSGGE